MILALSLLRKEINMIRKFEINDLDKIMELWLDTNLQAHSFIPKTYWINHYNTVKQMLPQATAIYIYEKNHQIQGFLGLQGNYIAGIFVNSCVQSNGIGKQLLDYAKQFNATLILQVYQKNIHAVRFYQREQFKIETKQLDKNTKEIELTMKWKSCKK